MADNIFYMFRVTGRARDTEGTLPVTHIVVGLGNPGEQYYNTRHNTGFLCVDRITEKLGVSVKKLKFKALVGDTVFAGKRVLIMKPQTYMNNSGEAVREAADFYKIKPENIIVICDDINLDVGRMRVRRRGSSGGQKGLNSIIEHMGSEDIPRIRIGIGMKPDPAWGLADWVLSTFPKADEKTLIGCFDCAYDGLGMILNGDFDNAMQLCNSKK